MDKWNTAQSDRSPRRYSRTVGSSERTCDTLEVELGDYLLHYAFSSIFDNVGRPIWVLVNAKVWSCCCDALGACRGIVIVAGRIIAVISMEWGD